MLDLTHTDADAAYHNWLEAERVTHSPERECAFMAGWNILSRFIAGSEQEAVDWFVVAEAVRDACDEELGGPKDYQRQFGKADLLVIHRKANTQNVPAPCNKVPEIGNKVPISELDILREDNAAMRQQLREASGQ